MHKLLDCNNFWSPSGGGVRSYHLEKIEYYKKRTDVAYVFIMHDDRTYTEQIGANAYIEHLKVPKVLGNWEYRYQVGSKAIAPLLLKHNPDTIEVGSPYFMPRIVVSIVKNHKLKANVFGFWHADFPITYVGRFLTGMPFNLQKKGESLAWRHARKYYNQMNGVLVSSKVVLERMEANGINNVSFAPLGVNNILFNPDKKNDSLIKKFKAGNANRIIMFFPHRFSKEKGLHILLKAYESLCERMEIEPALVIAGTGPYENLVKDAAKKFDHVHFVGFVKGKQEMAEYYASADLGFALSSWETFGLSIVEALSSGLPLIAAGEGASREHIEKSGAGIILASLSPQSLTDAVLEFRAIEDKVKLREKAVFYSKNLCWENCFDRQLEIYQSEFN